MTDRLDVLVVGAGPTGLTLACDLLRRGLRIRTIDAAAHGFTGSRAKGIQPRTLEVFDDLEVLDDIAAHATTYPKLAIHLGPLTLPKTMIARHDQTEDVPHPDTLLIAQYDTDGCLRRRLTDLGGQVEFRTRIASQEDQGDGIVATIEGPGGLETIRTRFLVGADGGASAVRKQAGTEFVGSTDESDRIIVADVVVDELSRDRWHIWPRRAGRFTGLCPLPGGEKFQLMIRLREGEQPALDLASIDQRVHAVTGVHVREIDWSSVWRPNVRLVGCYREGSVLLAGDSAHVHTPAGAQGLNTGIQDAYNLGWKLGQVLAGAPESLLDSYDAERRPVAARVLGLSSELYQDLSGRPLAALNRGAEARQLTLSYRGGPLAADSGDREDGVRAGDRAPDARYVTADGCRLSLFAAFRGPHFTLLAVGDAAVAGLATHVWPDSGASLRAVEIVTGAAPGLERIYGLDRPAQILVRPDGYVAYVATSDYEARLARAAAVMAPSTSVSR